VHQGYRTNLTPAKFVRPALSILLDLARPIPRLHKPHPQLEHRRGIRKIILGGMLANMCVESHLRELLERGFEVAVVKDATAGPRHPAWGDGYQAAMINYRFLAHAVMSTKIP
jgi:hypothetical protein